MKDQPPWGAVRTIAELSTAPVVTAIAVIASASVQETESWT